MTWHTMVLSEADPRHNGFIRRYYATIEVAMSGTSWTWCLVDASGNYVDNASNPLPTEDTAKEDALKKLNGDKWE